MSENYIMLNGKRIDLTDEQFEKLGLKVEKDCFRRLKNNQKYYCIREIGKVESFLDNEDKIDDEFYKVANYCTDKSLMEQRALHETLSRLLWRFSMQNDGDKIDWHNANQCKYQIYYNHYEGKYFVSNYCWQQYNGQYYRTEEIAKRAIDEIILPFMKEHPDFVW